MGIALVGNPDILILDEPTSGMDHVGKNLTWELLQRRKEQQYTTLLTTHNMLELSILEVCVCNITLCYTGMMQRNQIE